MADPNRSIRLTFEYEGENIELKKARRVNMRPPAATDPSSESLEAVAGHFVELTDENRRSVYRQFVPPFIPRTLEVPTGDPERPFTVHPVEKPRGIFHVIVPDIAGAGNLALRESIADKAQRDAMGGAAARTVFEVNLRDVKELGGE